MSSSKPQEWANLEKLFREALPSLVACANRLIANTDPDKLWSWDPDELVQEAYVEAWRHRQRFQGEGCTEFCEWVRAIMGNVNRNLMRTKGFKKRSQERIDHSFQGNPKRLEELLFDQTLADLSEAAEIEEALTSALRQLSDLQIRLLHFIYVERLSTKEVARRLGVSTSAVYRSLERARASLRNNLYNLDSASLFLLCNRPTFPGVRT